MIQFLKWAVLGIAAYLCFLIAKMPAQQLVNRIELPKNISIVGVRGTIWQGKASQVLVNNVAIDNVKWQLSFWSLLTANLHLDIDAGDMRASDKISAKGPITVNLLDKNHLKAENFSIYMPASMILAQVKLPIYVDAEGRFKLQIDELDYPSVCTTLKGTGQWLNAGVDGIVGLSEPLTLGNFSAQLGCIENDVLVSIDPQNIFNLSADARLPQSLKVSIDGKFKPDDSLPKQVKEAAKFFGRTDAQGYYTIKF
ncbi:type II secretion system protein N [Aliiglaciecola sp. LCG003]|uniref:type II secretion system protein N n=1 Tax=Aliiglaciecola sp. LCG003 TaxID=3053655 RepID=UPI002572B4B1|nr:type II secretion system protein N [Aliiglaciecola sp. LCG003]WJG09305.1 type II secretion system protein N [Aliiglaciecola sp. LCG003]